MRSPWLRRHPPTHNQIHHHYGALLCRNLADLDAESDAGRGFGGGAGTTVI